MGTRTTLHRPGLTPYQDAWQLQQRIADDVRIGGAPALILIEHPPTYTLGARGKAEHLLLGEEALLSRGAQVLRTDRGGDVTFHGPGQVVAYPIINLRAYGQGPVWYVRTLEALLIEVLSRFGIVGARSKGRPGVWVGEAKIAAIGVRISRGVTTHGFALNVNTDLAYFEHIVPCGLSGITVTSMRKLTGSSFEMRAVEDEIIEVCAQRFDLEFDTVDAERAGRAALAGASVGR
ncbi:MAG: lipoyl(octanoyl) transferase LipB [Chloroflexota bacterium]|nr:lipoyl(octanoyl) transferase LipB [Chloroflexota bacterium]